MPSKIIVLADAVAGQRRCLSPDLLRNAHQLWFDGLKDLVFIRRTQIFGQDSVYCAESDALEEPVLICGHCSSALDVAWALKEFLPEWSSVLAVSQWSGRGQLRRQWHSPPGNLYAALRWPADEVCCNGPLALAIALCLCRALEKHGLAERRDLRVKWPNDILFRGRKAAGILVEERGRDILAGIGLNLVDAPAQKLLSGEIPAMAAGRFDLPVNGALPKFWLTLVQEMKMVYRNATIPKKDFWADMLEQLNARLAFLGEPVLYEDTAAVEAKVLGLSGDGGLRLAVSDGREILVHSGSIRPLRSLPLAG